jgi:diguanylate cyclase (GGDEF)-like protein/PAS domain S-box-containing protein
MTDKEIRSGEDSVVQKQTKEALRESENKYRLLIENSHDIIYALDLQGFFTFASPSWKRILGQNNDAVVGHRFHEFVHPDDIPRCEKFLASLLETPEPLLSIEYRVRNVEGEWRWYSSNAAPVINADGTCTSFVGIGNDVTDRKQADEALASSLSLLKATMESTADGILVVDLNGRITLWNHKFSDMWKIPEELLSKHLDELVLNYVLQQMAQPETFLAKVRELHEQPEESSNDQLDLADGRIFGRYSQPQRIGDNVVGRVWSFSDITERKRAEEETRRERAFLDRLVESAPEGIAITDTHGRVMRVNAEFVRMFGYRVDEVIGQSIDDLVASPARQEEAREITTSSVQGGKTLLETVRCRKDGTLVDVSLITAPILIAGKQEAVYAIYRDITKRKQAEDKLQVIQLQWSQFLEASPDLMWIKDASGRYVAANKTYYQVESSVNGDVVGKTAAECFPPEKAARYMADDRVAIEKGASESEFNVVGVDGKLRNFLTKKVVLRTPDGSVAGTLGISRDITERKQMEQKLEEMATHDFLTGLPNRALLLDRFTIAAALAHRNKARLAVMSLDLDKFKSINDTLGHDAGDQVLKVISTRLVRILRASDTFARVGGDEFISVMMETDHIEEATAIANKILDSFTEPLSIAGHQLHLSTSIGIAIYPDDAEDLETLTKKSDAAMYYSKSHGRNQFKFYGDGDVQIS